jgi:hypothetical protein
MNMAQVSGYQGDHDIQTTGSNTAENLDQFQTACLSRKYNNTVFKLTVTHTLPEWILPVTVCLNAQLSKVNALR